eukprot:m.10521 g.10521  ORF g.10521 m.10521 type:complete len:409 (+) comp22390_c0_seq2:128-1354(+)
MKVPLSGTVFSVDNSEYTRNGDFFPTRLQAEQDAVNLICQAKHKSNAENNFGLLSLSEHKVLVTLTSEVGKVLTAMHGVQPKGDISLVTGIRVAQLALKHRQTKNHKQRLVLFVGSPIQNSDKELTTVAKRLKKEKVAVDVISFGEDVANSEKLTLFVNTVNGDSSKSGPNSHLVTISNGPVLSEPLLSSPVLSMGDGSGSVGGLAMGGGGGSYDGFLFGVDPNEDPELALALRVSLEEQRQRSGKESQEESKPMEEESAEAASAQPPLEEMVQDIVGEADDEEENLQKALAMSMQMELEDVRGPEPAAVETFRKPVLVEADGPGGRDNDDDDDDEDEEEEDDMELDETGAGAEVKEEDLGDVIDDPEFLQSVLSDLPGVDPHSEAIQQVIESTKQRRDEKEKKGSGQ